MALSRELEEELTCPIHMELYIEPMSLKCLHTLCKKDIDYVINEDELVVCPQCKVVSQKRDIKHDFRTQRLLDLHTTETNRLKQETLCDNCMGEVATSWCEQCDGLFGDNCGKGHLKFKTTKHHNLIKISTIIEENKSKIHQKLKTVKTASDSINDNLKYVSDCALKFDEEYKATLDEIYSLEEQLISTCRSAFKGFRQKIRSEIEPRKQEIEKLRIALLSNQHKTKRNMELLKDILHEMDPRTLLDKELITGLLTEENTKEVRMPSHDIDCVVSKKEIVAEISEMVNDVKNELNPVTDIQQQTSTLSTPQVKSKTKCQSLPVDSITKQNENYLKPNSPKSEVLPSQDPQNVDTIVLNQPLKPLTLENYTEGEVKAIELQFDLPEVCQKVRFITVINDCVWLVMENGNVNMTILTENAILKYQKQIPKLIYVSKPDMVIRKIIQGPGQTIIAFFEMPGYYDETKLVYVESEYQTCEINENGEQISRIGEDNTYRYVVADATYVYGISGKTVLVHQCCESRWPCIRNVNLSDEGFDYCVHNGLITMEAGLFTMDFSTVRYDLSNNKDDLSINPRRLSVETANLHLSDTKGNILMDEMFKPNLKVLLQDDSVKDIDVDLGKNRKVESATLDKYGRLLVLLDDGALCLVLTT